MSSAYTPSSCRISSNNRPPDGEIRPPDGEIRPPDGEIRPPSFARRRFAAACLLLGVLPMAESARALPEDADQPINIRADSVEYDQNGNRIIYRGSVQVDQGTLRVNAETMTIDLQDGKKVLRITAEDTPARYQQQIELGEPPVKAEALTIIYHTQDERVDLRGSANLEQQGSTLAGDLIIYDIVAGRVDASATRQAPVTMVLQPSAVAQDEAEQETPSDPMKDSDASDPVQDAGPDGVER
jgi:lipopolysaccharide export system protein LptA